MALASGDRELGREIAAEAFARALERWERVGRMASPDGWTYRVAVNLLRRHHRRADRERTALGRLGGPAPEAPPSPDPELWAAVAMLPVRERTAVALRYGADLTEPAIAEVMGVAVGTVSATLHHARTRLRTVLAAPEVLDDRR